MGPPPLHWLDTNWWCSNHSIVVLLLHVLSSSFPMQFLPLPLDVVSFYSFLKLIPFTRVCLSRKQCGFVLSSPFGLVDLSRYFLYYFLLTPVGPTHLAFFFFFCSSLPHGASQGLFSSLLERVISPWLALPYCSWAVVFYSLFFYGYSFSLGLRDMVLLFLPLFLSLFFLSPGLIWAFLPLGPCYQKWELTLCIPLYNIIVLHTCILPFLMISLANDEIL